MIRRHKTTIFTDAKESTTVHELKRIVEGILKRPPEDQRLYKVRVVYTYAISNRGSNQKRAHAQGVTTTADDVHYDLVSLCTQ